MIKSYLKTAIRNIWKSRLSSGVNVLGLSLGMAMCMLIMMLVIDQNSYDGFHRNKDRIYRIITDRTSNSSSSFATAPLPLYSELVEKAPGIEKAVRIKAGMNADVRYKEKTLPSLGAFTDPVFFEIFDFHLLHGDPATALKDPFSLILTEESALKLGLNGSDAVGEVIEIGDLGPFTVRGIVADPPGRTHIRYEFLASYSSVRPLEQAGKLPEFSEAWWSTNDGFIYLLLSPGVNAKDIESHFPAISDREYAERENFRLDFRLQPLARISPSELLENDMTFTVPKAALYFLSVLAFLVLATAFFNYANLSVARGLTRAREVGVRKIFGARRGQIFMQFVSEALVISVISLILAIGLLEMIIIPQFQSLFFSQFFEMKLGLTFEMSMLFLAFTLVVGLVAGLIPASYLSAFQPVRVLQSLKSLKVFSRLGWRKALIVGQFAVALIFMISATVLFQQSRFMLYADYGFDKENIVNVELQGQDYQKLKTELSRHSSIKMISGSSLVLAGGTNQGTSFRIPDQDENIPTHQVFTDDMFLSNFDLALNAGRNFHPATDSTSREIIINETAMRRIGWKNAGEAVGQTLLMDANDNFPGDPSIIVGVVEDFHYVELQRPIGNLIIRHDPTNLRFANLRIHTADIQNTLQFIEDTWAGLDPVHPVSYRFMDDQIAMVINVFFDLLKILGFLAVAAIAICCLGLLGIASYTVETRTKEIGIRKVLGAGIGRIIWTLSRSLVYPLLVAVILALPAGWFLNRLWLQEIAYHVPLTAFNLGFGVLIIGSLAGLVLVSQSWRIARKNPVESLRYE
jgi:putative ABC transport system permease protein